MSRWWRAYDEAVDDPKLQRLGAKLGWAWFNLMCIASANEGALPSIGDVAFKLRCTEQQAAAMLTGLVSAGLFDMSESGCFAPHNWKGRQFLSDRDSTATERKRRERDKKRSHSDVTRDTCVMSRPPETETETEQIQKDSEANASGAEAPVDHRKRLFDEGLRKLAAMTGKGPDACRSFVGKCLKAASDDAVTVLGLIEDAERNQTVNPTAWIVARLQPTGNPNGRRTLNDAVNDQLARLHALDEPAPSGLCDATSAPPVRLLSSG